MHYLINFLLLHTTCVVIYKLISLDIYFGGILIPLDIKAFLFDMLDCQTLMLLL